MRNGVAAVTSQVFRTAGRWSKCLAEMFLNFKICENQRFANQINEKSENCCFCFVDWTPSTLRALEVMMCCSTVGIALDCNILDSWQASACLDLFATEKNVPKLRFDMSTQLHQNVVCPEIVNMLASKHSMLWGVNIFASKCSVRCDVNALASKCSVLCDVNNVASKCSVL